MIHAARLLFRSRVSLLACQAVWQRYTAAGISQALDGSSAQSLRAFASASQAPTTASHGKLAEHLRSKILMRGGPISIAEFMADALTSPHGGYYMSRDVFGAAGDFITSPEISQMFGEMIGIWAVHTWMLMGQPSRLNLVELGPGRGTLMADLIRGTAAFKKFGAALQVHMVEVSPALRTLQWSALRCEASAASAESPDDAALTQTATHKRFPEQQSEVAAAAELSGKSALAGCQVTWHNTLDTVPQDVPALYIAHEFFDALPVHQFYKDVQRGWLEKMVDIAEQEEGTQPAQTSDCPTAKDAPQLHWSESGQPPRFRLVLSPTRTPASALLVPRRLANLEGRPLGDAAARPGLLVPQVQGLPQAPESSAAVTKPGPQGDDLQAMEVSAKAMAAAEALAVRVGRHGGAALIIDYGQDGPYADSLVALRGHQKQEVLQDPGSADLSVWVDFSALKQAAVESGSPVRCHGPVTQAHFLSGLGIQARLEQLLKRAKSKEAADALQSGFDRVTGTDGQAMGASYKAMVIAHSSLPGMAGFDAPM